MFFTIKGWITVCFNWKKIIVVVVWGDNSREQPLKDNSREHLLKDNSSEQLLQDNFREQLLKDNPREHS